MNQNIKISVLLPKAEAVRFDSYCRAQGFKKSTLIARLIREHMDASGYHMQPELFPDAERKGKDR